ncbi:MAG: Gfo/Idh/MocA family oxidoreductase [Propionibacteriaceae bacterium]|nr:Gfo/Idh/MocA family oxidoreductase [Propionibacteriaceae bacterium]
MSTSKTKVAIMSFAHHHAGFYLPTLLADETIEVLASDELWPDAPGEALRGPAFAERHGVPYVETYDELLAWGPDAVIVCSENTRHHPDVLRAAAAGAHVMCEKPLATSVEAANDMVRACREAGVNLMTAYPIRFTPMFRALQAAVLDGEIGEIVGATGTNNGTLPGGWFIVPELSGGGALLDLTVHIADMMDALLSPVRATSVYAAANDILYRDVPGLSVETGGLVTVSYADGVVATIDCSWSHPQESPTWGGLTLEVIGTRGSVEIDPFGLHVGGIENSAGKAFWLDYGSSAAVPMLQEFLASIAERRPPVPDGADGVRSVEIAVAASRSARDGQAVPLGVGGDSRAGG